MAESAPVRWRGVFTVNEMCLQACYHSNAQVNNGIEKVCVEIAVKS